MNSQDTLGPGRQDRRLSLQILGSLVLAGVIRQILSPRLGAVPATAIGIGVFGAVVAFALLKPKYRTGIAAVAARACGGILWAVSARM